MALSSATAAALLVELGDILPATVDPNEPMLRNVFPRPTTEVELEVVGLFTVDDPREPYWFDESTLAEAAIGGTEESPIAFATALFASEAYADVLTLGLPNRYRWRFFVDTEPAGCERARRASGRPAPARVELRDGRIRSELGASCTAPASSMSSSCSPPGESPPRGPCGWRRWAPSRSPRARSGWWR